MFQKFLDYINKDIWHIQIDTLPKAKSYWIRFLRIVIIVLQGFTKSQIQQGASALTYYTLLALVPMIAILIAISRIFQLEKGLENWLMQEFGEQKEVIGQIFDFANTALKESNQGLIAGVGLALLFWAALKILIYIENVMNQIWEVRKGRSFARRFSDYLALIVIAPVIIFLSSGINIYLTAAITALGKGGILKHIGDVLVPLAQLIPFLLIAFLWTFLYIFMPNTKVNFIPALIAGVSMAIFYQFVQWVYFYLQIGVSKYNAVYGTYAAIPLFLIWVHISWVIILLGAKIAFAIQNFNAYEFISDKVALSHRFKSICSLRVTHYIIKKYMNGDPAPTLIEISNALRIPHTLTRYLLYILVSAGILSEVVRKDDEIGFHPAKSPESLTIKQVLDMIDKSGREIPLPPSPELNAILESLAKFNSAIEKSDGNRLLKDI